MTTRIPYSMTEAPVNVKAFGAKGDGTTDDTAAIQGAIDACPIYGSVFMPKGTYKVTGSITLSEPIKLFGEGFGTLLSVAPTVGATTDIIKVQPTTDGHYLVLKDFAIAPASGTPGRHAIYLDSTNHYFMDGLIDNVVVYQLGGNAIYCNGNGGGEGSVGIFDIQRCVLMGGIAGSALGDLVRVTGNHFAGTGKALDIAFQAGASTFTFRGNSVTSKGGIKVGASTTALLILENELETFSDFTGSNGAFIDLDGTSSNPINEAIIANNSFQIVNGVVTDTIRVNYANRTQIFGNRFGAGASGSNDVKVTANAANTMIGNNAHTAGAPIVSDASSSTTILGAVGGKLRHYSPLESLVGDSGIDVEVWRLGRRADGNRYSSVYAKSDDSGNASLTFKVHDGATGTSQKDVLKLFGSGRVVMANLPTSSSGLPSGALWNDSGTVKIV